MSVIKNIPEYRIHTQSNTPGYYGTIITVDWWAKIAKHKGKYLDKHIYFSVQTERPELFKISKTMLEQKMKDYIKRGRYHDYYY